MSQHSEQSLAVGQRIVQARLEQGGMQQKELAQELGVSARSVQAYERGEVVPWRFMEDLSRILKKPIPWFLHGTDASTGSSPQAPDEVLSLLHESLRVAEESLGVSKEILLLLRAP